ncbi:cytosolic phospholipase A2 zeta-like [Megalops cyprinoides]|uniref:cytosolic phospholipase A2 zeta-like n=1 Tax=Megalops cyprinoides TaxID=118141 RepID=UPI00186527B9|nr:cytosolic phospholipase A2 zeta-like [Megalops cyprinoides]
MSARLGRITGQVLPLLSAAVLQQRRREQETQKPAKAWRDVDPYWNVTVKVLRAKNIPKHDTLSESDCYVSLRLPTASSRTYHTQTVPNSRNPEWNETFQFRVHSHVKNILELNVLDKDLLTSDDLCATVLFDFNNLCPGKKERKVFTLDPEEKDELWVEFQMEESEDPPGEYITNGVLVAGPFSLLEVKVEESSKENERQDLVLKLNGAYEEEQVVLGSHLPASVEQPIQFHINRDLETELEVHRLTEKNEEDTRKSEDEAGGETQEVPDRTTVPLKSLPLNHEVTLSVPVGKDEIDLQLKAKDCSDALDVRLGFDIPKEEKAFLEKRKDLVSRTLQKALLLPSAPESHQVPVVAVVGSGGGTRAMTALYGSLKGLQTLGLLDAVSYITGVSGSTWTMSNLYADSDWSQRDMEAPLSSVRSEISKSLSGILSPGQLKYYIQELQKKAWGGQLVSFIDVFGLMIEHLIHGKTNCSTLSSQQRAVAEGQNPYPIYTAVNVKDGINGSTAVAEWCEFTPYEVGIPKYGAFVRTEDFGSEFYMGHLIKKHPEMRISFLLGMWSSVLSFNLTQVVRTLTGSVPTWISGLGEDIHDTDESDAHGHPPSALHTYFIEPVGNLTEMLENLLTDRPIISQTYNFLRGFSLHWNYSESNGFLTWKDTHVDAFPNSLTPSDSKLKLVDSGFAINVGFPPLMRPQRNVDLILSFNYSWQDDQFKVLKHTAQYCADHRLPFPNIDFSSLEGKPLQECYLFRDEDNPSAPIVLHFPLINASFREFRAPGVRRVGEVELTEGQVDVSSSGSPYRTYHFTYTPEEFQRLVALTSYNVVNNKETILRALQLSLNRHNPTEKMTQPSQMPSESPSCCKKRMK